MFTPRALHIVDPELVTAGGHNMTQDVLIVQECEKRGIPVTLYARCGADVPALGDDVVKVFRFDVFVERPPSIHEFGPFENYFLVNRAFYLDLCSIPNQNFSSDDLVYFPSVTQNQLEGISDWLTSLPAGMRPHVAITLRWLNSQMHYNLNRNYGPAVELIYRHALAKLVERHPSTRIFSDTSVLCATYSGISGVPVTKLPLPQVEFDSEGLPRKHIEGESISVLYVGNTSAYRGSQFLPEIIASVLNEFPNTHFTVQIQASLDSEVAKTMMAIPDVYKSKVTFLFGTLSPEDYASTMRAADIVLLPYMPAFYSWASSGVFTEAGALGKILVVTAGTTLEAVINEYGLGAFIAREWSAESFSHAIKEAILNFDVLTERAHSSRERFCLENSPRGFLDKMFSYM